jgi:TP901 family phage tail tape measure protein
MAAITLDIGGNTRQLDRDIQKTVNKVYSINLKTKGDQPLGRITGQVNEFTKSLDASNARVIAFGASAGIIFGIEKAFSALVSSTIEVQKSLQDINVILNVSTSQLQKFGGELFNIARNTGQSFQAVANAATEFSRQGLGVEETLKRTNDALILARLSGLDTVKSVEALTAAVNSFASQAVTATEVVNKFATVDAAFAVSSADLADAVARVGSSAAQSGVNLNELIAIVTAAQQTTARGGAVIGNSFKTIFTRLQRGKVIDLLESLGISTTDSAGELKSTIQLLQDLGKVYDTLGTQQQAYVAEQVGGVFQINILKAALADLGKEYSIYNNALNVAAGATDQAIQRNEELNKTYAAQINALQENAKQLAAAGGERLLGPTINRLVGGTNTLLQGFTESDGQGIGAILGKGILDGLGQFIAGPGIALIGGVLLKLFRDLAKFATGSVQQLLGLNTAATQQRDLQASIQQILSKNPQLLELALKGEQGLNQAANSLLANLQKQTVELQKQAQVAAQISKAFVSQAGVRVTGGIPTVPNKGGKIGRAAGYIPNFASDKLIEKYTAISLGATSSVRPHMSKGTIGGRKFVMNNQEVEFPGVGKNGDSMVIPKYGDGPRIAAAGFVPNFAPKVQNIDLSTIPSLKTAITRFGVLYPQGGDGTKPFSQPLNTLAGLRNRKDVPSGSARITLPYKSIYPITQQETSSIEDIFDKSTDTFLSAGMTNLARDIANTINQQAKGKVRAKENPVDAKSLPRSTKGIIFETAVKGATRDLTVSAKEGDQEAFDFDPVSAYPALQGLFGFTGKGNSAVEAKIGESAAKNIPNKILNQYPGARNELFKMLGLDKSESKPKRRISGEKARQIRGYKSNQYSGPTGFATGYIPNFAAIAEVMALETAISGEKAIFDTKPFPHVRNKSQPTFGSAMADHGGKNRALKDSMMGQKRAGLLKSSGFIPNFAIEDPDVQAAGLGSSIAAVVTQLGFLAFALRGITSDYKNNIQQIIDKNKQLNFSQLEGINTQQKSVQQNKLNIAEQRRSGQISKETARLKFDELKIQQASLKGQAARFGTASTGQKFGAGLESAGFALSLVAPIIAETIKNAIGQETAGARRTGEVVSGVGQIASFAGVGASFGPWGAAIGAATGAFLTVPGIIESLLTDLPEFQAATQKASQNLTKLSDGGANLFTAYENLRNSINEGSQFKINKAQEALAVSLNQFSTEQKKRLESAIETGNLEETYGKILKEQSQILIKAEFAEAISKLTGEINFSSFTKNAQAVGSASAVLGPLGGGLSNISSISKLFTPEAPLSTNKDIDNFSQAIQSRIEKSLDPTSIINKLSAIKLEDQDLGLIKNIEDLSNFLKKTDLFSASEISGILQLASKDGVRLENTIRAVTSAIQNLNKNSQENLNFSNKLTSSETNRLKVLKNLYTENLKLNSAETLALKRLNFTSNRNVSSISNQKALLESIVGSSSPRVRSLSNKADIAKIESERRSSLLTAGLDLKRTIRDLVQEELSGSTNKIGDSDIEKIIDGLNKVSKQFITNPNSNNDLSTGVTSLLSNFGIFIDENSKINQDIKAAIIKYGESQEETEEETRQKLIEKLDEQVQAIKQQKVEQSLGSFGGIKSFIDMSGSETLADQVISAITDLSRFNVENGAPAEAGRESLRVISLLRELSGGAMNVNPQSEAFLNAVSGRTQDIQSVLDRISSTEGNFISGQQVENFKKAIESLGGPQQIASLQVAQEAGTLSESTFEKITGKYENAALEELRQNNSQLADLIARDAEAISKDKSVGPLVTLNTIQGNALTELREINQSIANFVAPINVAANQPTASTPTTVNQETNKTTSVSLGGLTLNLSTDKSNSNYDQIIPRIKTLLEREIPKIINDLESVKQNIGQLNRTKDIVDNMSRSPSSAASKSAPPPQIRYYRDTAGNLK